MHSQPAFHRWRSLFLLLVAGAAFGATNSIANHHNEMVYFTKLVGNDWGWLTAAMIACWAVRSWLQAFVRGLAFLFPAVLAYYISDALHGTYITVDMRNPTGPKEFDLLGMLVNIFAYSVISLLTAAVLGLLVVRIHQRGFLGLVAWMAVPSYVAWSAWHTHSYLGRTPDDPELLRVADILFPVAIFIAVLPLLRMTFISLRHRRPPSGAVPTLPGDSTVSVMGNVRAKDSE